MSNDRLAIPDEFPVVEHNSISMPLPAVWIDRFLRYSYYEFLVQEAREAKAPFVFAVMQRQGQNIFPEKEEGLYRTGVVCSVETVDDVEPRVVLFGIYRAKAGRYIKKANGLWVASFMERVVDESEEQFVNEKGDMVINPDYQVPLAGLFLSIRNKLLQLCRECVEFAGQNDADTQGLINLYDNFYNYDFNRRDAIDKLVWEIIFAVPVINPPQKQHFIEQTSLVQRIAGCLGLLELNLDIMGSANRQDAAANSRMQKSRRRPGSDVFENGGSSDAGNSTVDTSRDSSEPDDEDKSFAKTHSVIKKAWERFKKVRNFMNEDAKTVAREDIDRLVSYGSPRENSYEWPKFKRHLDFILDLPWGQQTKEESDIMKVARILDEDHYGLTHIKERICDSIAPRLLNPLGRGQIICFVGPPGVGKTSLAKSIARAMNRKLIRMSVGGIRDETQIRGHDVTYVGSQPGEILREIKRCGVKNPIFVIDEIDKLGHYSTAGDPSSAMLEVLDPEQNYSFKDHYLGCSFDLSKVMFIATANVEADIILPLHDRMDVIRLPGYLEVEKIEIAKRYLVPRWMEEVGLTKNNIQVGWGEESIPLLIRGYTNEAGVRNLDRNIATILRKIAGRYLKSRDKNEAISSFRIETQTIDEILGPVKFFKDKIRPTKVGEAIGLAWTPVGGEILYVQAETYPRLQDKKVLARTGMQGKVMEESDEVAMTLLRNELEKIDPELSKKLQNCSVHLHIPEGAVPKDGPSAGVTIFAALLSEITGWTVKSNLAMTGEIDIKGSVVSVGGIREKVVAAERAGITDVILPKANQRNIHDVPEPVKQKIQFHFVESIQEVIDIAFEKPE
ncbi:MAG: endopeptidase La [Candidatus Yanofskybacteria bacterium RIFCSPHIGHO2_01_FULL_45_42]|uniref:endopeptidase La n=2 Tax=Candidatus Yanofskyibacteriota TaxID=1752733 RepID=A0A1F8FPH0_9BACT|nr:MAG: endopeptidase La [Candidatus Yanofskybacteria bacterium RIFCSPHIGHO2_01_FULL_45_42]OGN14952.1 MAG: endopeptidase La [Candidatus Yanofskybacteria bacterium RIFCSPHIGHO2_02_FULL_43_22]